MAEHSRIDDLKRRVQSDPASIAFAALAEEYRRAGQYEEAIATCRAGLQRHPAYLSARVTLGRALLEVERLDEARQELEYVLKVAPENLAAIRGLAEIHHRRGDLTEEEHYKAALEAAQRESHAAEHHATPHQAAPQQAVAHPAPQPPAARKPVSVSTAVAPAAAAPVAPAGTPAPAPSAAAAPVAAPTVRAAAPAAAAATQAPAPSAPPAAARPVIQPDRAQQSAATPAPVPAADPALAGLEAYLSAILRAREDLESTSLRR